MKLRIKEAIKDRGLTVKDVADMLGVTKQSLHNLITKGNPTFNSLCEIASVIGVPISELYLDGDDHKNLTALVYHNDSYYRASSLDELKNIVAIIEADNSKDKKGDVV